MTGANVARAMQLSAPTVHEMVGRLERDGYIERNEAKAISFTGNGLEQAKEIVSRHRLIERYLTDVVGVPWTTCTKRLSDSSTRCHLASRPTCAPRSVMPRRARTVIRSRSANRIAGVPLADVEVGASVEILRFENEAEDLLHYLKRSGFEPGLTGTMESSEAEEVTLAQRRRRHPHTHAQRRRDRLRRSRSVAPRRG